MRTPVLCVVLAVACLPRAAGAQTLLTEADALARLSSDSPRVAAIRAAIDVARADALAAGRFPNPRILWDRESVPGTTEHIVTLSQPLPITGRRRLETDAAQRTVAAVEARADEALRQARADLRLAYARLVAAQATERALAGQEDRLRELATILTRREAAGDAAGFDRLRAERELIEVRTDRSRAASDRIRAQAVLASFFPGDVDPTTVTASAAVATVPALPDLAALVDRAFKTRPELLALAREVESAELSQRAAERRRIPEPELGGGLKQSSLADGDAGVVLTIQASVPLFDRAAPERALAIARARQASAREAAMRQSVRAEIAGLYTDLINRRDTVTRYRDSAVPSSESIARIAQVSYDAGERGILELLDALQTRSAAALREIELWRAVREAEIELEFISGWELP